MSYLQSIASCWIVKVWPAMATVPVRIAIVVFESTLRWTCPFPVPSDPSATAIHASLLTAVQAHPEAVLTSTFTSDRSGPTVRDVGSMLLLHCGAAPA